MIQRKEAAFDLKQGAYKVKVDLAEMLKGGLIVGVANAEQAQMAQDVGAIAVVVTQPAAEGLIPRFMSNPDLIKTIQEAVSVPVIAKCRIGHFVEAQILEAHFVDFIDESEELPSVDVEYFIDKHAYKIPFICGCANLSDALSRIAEGAVFLRVTGNPTTPSMTTTVQSLRTIFRQIRYLSTMDHSELMNEAKRMGVSYPLLEDVADTGQLPVPLFAGGAVSIPADAALLMLLGAQSVVIENTIFSQKNPEMALKAMVAAVVHSHDPEILSRISRGLLCDMPDVDIHSMENDEALLQRGW